jgi:hypothetical protein
MQSGGREFLTDQPMSFATYEEEKIDIHHIFPKIWCQANKIEAKRMDCIVNKTAISARTNRIIGGAPPAKYLGAASSCVEASIQDATCTGWTAAIDWTPALAHQLRNSSAAR